jgi:hypothetical protein
MSSDAASCHRLLCRPDYQDPVPAFVCGHRTPQGRTRLSRRLLRQACSYDLIIPGAVERWPLTPQEESHDTRPL